MARPSPAAGPPGRGAVIGALWRGAGTSMGGRWIACWPRSNAGTARAEAPGAAGSSGVHGGPRIARRRGEASRHDFPGGPE